MEFVRVALNVPIATLFDYRAKDATPSDVGRRVLVPFGKKIAVGIIMGMAQSSALPAHNIRHVLSILREEITLPADVLALFDFCSNYYQYPIGKVVLGGLPSRLRNSSLIKTSTVFAYRLTEIGRLGFDALPARSSVKRELLSALLAAPHVCTEQELRAIAPSALTVLKNLVQNEWVERFPVDANPDLGDKKKSDMKSELTLNVEQASVVATVNGRSGFAPWLLRGVTGSGKTEVYLQLIAEKLNAGLQALLLVPEINLTPQLESVIKERFPAHTLASIHSGLNESERLHNWMSAQRGTADIVIGTRLAIFTPLPRLGIIIVDEEHDASFKQNDGLLYSARDLAVMRAKQRDVPLILGSATPALETYQKALLGDYGLLELNHRINGMPPLIECVDTRHEPQFEGISNALIAAIRETTRKGGQSLVFINRRGYAPVLACSHCGWTSDCPRCSAKLVLHIADNNLHCHFCGQTRGVPAACPQCGDQNLTPLGHGTQRIEAALTRIFPAARILRIDRDTTARKHAWRDMRKQIQDNDVDILVGTQILAKGHDFPQLNLVGVINADSSLYSTDFRAAERLYARLAQVAGRAGRGVHPGKVLIQTRFPGHPLYQALQRDNYPAYAKELLSERKAAGFPPYAHIAVLRAEAPKLESAITFLQQAANHNPSTDESITVYDPVPARLERRAGLARAQLTVQARSRSALHRFLAIWITQFQTTTLKTVRWALDVDPMDL